MFIRYNVRCCGCLNEQGCCIRQFFIFSFFCPGFIIIFVAVIVLYPVLEKNCQFFFKTKFFSGTPGLVMTMAPLMVMVMIVTVVMAVTVRMTLMIMALLVRMIVIAIAVIMVIFVLNIMIH